MKFQRKKRQKYFGKDISDTNILQKHRRAIKGCNKSSFEI
jgi:hypothetical protein